MRVSVGPDGRLLVGGHGPGRGAWLCRLVSLALPQPECLELARSRRAFTRALRRDVSPSEVDALLATASGRARMGEEPAPPGPAV